MKTLSGFYLYAHSSYIKRVTGKNMVSKASAKVNALCCVFKRVATEKTCFVWIFDFLKHQQRHKIS